MTSRKNKFLIIQVFIASLFLYKYIPLFQSHNIWYDDAHELLISKVTISDLKSFMLIADHHIGFSLLLKLLIQLFSFENIYTIIGCLNLGVFILVCYFLSKKDNFSLEVSTVQILILISPVVIDYIYKPKQYFLDLCIALFLVKYFSYDHNVKINKVFPLLFLSAFFSNILVIYFLIPLLKLVNKTKNRLMVYSSLLFTMPFFFRAYNKFFSESFREYWSSFYESSTQSFLKLFFNNLMFIRSFNDLGLLPLVIFIVSFGLFRLYKDNKNILLMVITPVVLLNLLNLINLYPIGAGRTDLILFPIFVYSIYHLLKYLSSKISIIYLLIVLLPIFFFIENNKVREDNTQELINNTYLYDFDLLYVSYYSIPQTILFDSEYGQPKRVGSKCFYNSINKKVVFMQSDRSEKCSPQFNFSNIENEISNEKKILIIGHESKTQNIENTIKKMGVSENNITIEKIGNNELLIAINFNN